MNIFRFCRINVYEFLIALISVFSGAKNVNFHVYYASKCILLARLCPDLLGELTILPMPNSQLERRGEGYTLPIALPPPSHLSCRFPICILQMLACMLVLCSLDHESRNPRFSPDFGLRAII